MHRPHHRAPAPLRFRPPVAAALLACALSGTAWHAGARAAEALSLSDAAPRQYDIPAGPLGRSLSAFALASGIALSFEPSLTDGKTGPALNGRMGAREAASRLLAGSGLEVIGREDGSFTLRRAAAGAEALQALPAVTVSAAAERSTVTEGSGSYTTRATGAATRMALSLRETPQSVSVIGRQQIEEQNLLTLNDVLRQTPGIVADRLDERVSFSSRGFALNTMIDGVPTLSFSSAAGEASMVSMQVYDRIEVVRGAAGLLNGSGSPGGSINLVRKRPTTEFSGHVGAGVGSWNRYSAEVDLSGKLNETGTLRGRVVASHADGNSFTDSKKQSEDVFYGIVEADLTRDTLLTAGVEYQRTAIKGANFGQSPLFYGNGAPTSLPRSLSSSAPWSTWNMETQRYFVNLEHHFDNDWRVKVDAALITNDRERYSADIWLYPGNINPVTNMGTVQVSNNPATSVTRALDVYATGPFSLFGRTHSAVLGANFNRYAYDYGNYSRLLNTVDRQAANILNLGAVAQPDFRYPVNQFSGVTEEKALYGALRFKPTDALSLIVGSRFSWYDNDLVSRTWQGGANGRAVASSAGHERAVFTPYGGLVYDLDEAWSAYASYTNIFQPNTVRDASNQVIAPRRGTNAEFGVKGEHMGGKLNSSFAVFEVNEDNATELDPGAALLPDGSAAYRAVSGAKTRGFETTLSGELARGWQLMAGYTYSAKFSNKNALMNTNYPQRMLRLATSYRLPGALSKLTVGGNLSYQSGTSYLETYSNKTAYQGGLTLIGLMARYDVSSQLSLSLNVENLTDKYYYTGFGGYNGYTYGNPRNAWFKANYKF
ncbi:TonB-dependent siderophore receptor [Herbaspirillum sp. WKF16]|uniref:TonB-dependent siderophore receptor n=1 Tax=Herbaspirillum sp. WKF16 TaxID=3028312 RepID=UPI0023A9A481|nr:TonB-dependent receptor [Herbaspirillum sp. WKF16]WDZ98231.1 TonB-dependent siderophore receptor [Herbaspirillum sp. WKF16]